MNSIRLNRSNSQPYSAGKLRRLIALLTAGSLMSGCTTRMTSSADLSVSGGNAVIGIPYSLPAASYELEAKWTFSGCELQEKVSFPDDKKVVEKAWNLTFDVAVTKKETLSSGQTFIIDYRQMAKTFKVGELKTEYHPGTNFLKSINATIEGKEPEAIIAGIKLAAGVAKLALTGNPVGGAVNSGDPVLPPELCTNEAKSLFQAWKDAKAGIKAIPETTEELTDELATLTVRNNLGSLSEDDKKRIKAIQEEIKRLATALKGLNSVVSALEKRLSYSKSWAVGELNSGSMYAWDVSPKTDDMLKLYQRLLTPEGRILMRAKIESKGDLDLRATLSVPRNGVRTATIEDGALAPYLIAKGPNLPGVVFRNPVKAEMSVCRLTKTPGPRPGDPPIAKCAPAEELLLKEVVSIPQLGQLRVLPLRSAWGENNNLEATFSETGQLTMAHYNRKAAPGVAAINAGNEALGALGGVITNVSEYRKKKKADEEALADAAQTEEMDALTRQIDLLTKQAALKKLTNPDAEDPVLEALQAKLAILRLQKEERELLDAINAP